jgi:hypothetical protein
MNQLLLRVRTFLHVAESIPLHRRGVRVFRSIVGAVLLFRIFSELRYAEILWGPNGIGTGSLRDIFGDVLGAAIDGLFESQIGVYCVVAALAVAALGLVFGRWERLAAAVAWLCFFSIGTRLRAINDGGDNVATLALMFSGLLLPNKSVAPSRLAIWCHNVGVSLLWFQICLLYVTSGMAKLAGNVWRDGTALYYISNVQWFAHPVSMEIFKYAIPATIAAYATMIHQIWFPFAVATRLRLVWLVFGMTFHLAIATLMGLISFSCFMIALEMLLISDEQYRWIDGLLGRLKQATIRVFHSVFSRATSHATTPGSQ